MFAAIAPFALCFYSDEDYLSYADKENRFCNRLTVNASKKSYRKVEKKSRNPCTRILKIHTFAVF